ncbi:MAG: hypothetical protein H0U27_14660, partial [Nitrosopumilus sp.]|nr:hypothetical protein [Nitrosopumilus sp.]
MKQQLLILIIVIVSNSLAFSQAIHDSIVSTDSYLKYISYKCLLRDSLKQAALNNNISSIQKLRNISIVFESNEVYYRSRLLTKREDILLQFLLQDYENILKDIKYDLHFFVDQENYRYNEFPA